MARLQQIAAQQPSVVCAASSMPYHDQLELTSEQLRDADNTSLDRQV